MVLAAMGAPISKVRELVDGSRDKHYEEWIFGQVPQTVRFVRFIGDRVVQIRIAALGQPIAVLDRDQMRGYFDSDPEGTNEVAMGDANSVDGDAGRAKPSSILKPGEIAPGSSRVQVPTARPSPEQDKNDSTHASSSGSTDSAAAPSTASKLLEISTR
jgi:hypothetical protein